MGKKARQYIIDNYSIEVVGKQFEELFDGLPKVDHSFEESKLNINPSFDPDDSLPDKEWIESLYQNILCRKDEKGVEHWVQRLNTDLKRPNVLNYFKKVAFSEIQKREIEEMTKEFEKNPEVKKIAFVQPEKDEEVIIATSLLPSIKKEYPNHKIYFFTNSKYFDLVNSHPMVDKVYQFSNKMVDPLFLEGKGDKPKYFDIVFAPFLSLRNNYTRNCEDKIQYNIYESR